MTEKAVEFLFSKQQKNGCWRTKNENIDKDSEGYDWIPAQTALPLTGIAAAGYGEDPRAQEAYKWLFEKQLDEGTWPAGWKNGTYGYIAGYRKMPHSRWGCRTNTTAVLMSLAYNQKLAQSDKAKSALDLLLARESQDLHNLGFNLARILGFEPIKGLFTFFAKFDPLLSLMLAKKIGADLNDERVVKLYGFIKSALNENNLFEYKSRPQASRWISYGILKTLKDFPQDTGWQSNQFTTPFRTYGKKEQRY